MKPIIGLLLSVSIVFSAGRLVTAAEPLLQSSAKDALDRAVHELQNSLNGPSGASNVHAADALLELGYGENVRPTFEKKLQQHGDELFARIGVWRVLARTGKSKAERNEYVVKLRDAGLNPQTPDSVDAAQSLARLEYAITERERSQLTGLAQDASAPGVPERRWLLAVSGADEDLRFLAELLDSPEAEVRGKTAYALRHLAKKLPPDVVTKLAKTVTVEPKSVQRVFLISAAYVTARDDDQARHFKELLLPYAQSHHKDEKCEAANALALRGAIDDLPRLTNLLNDSEADVRVSAAYAILRIDRRKPLPFEVLDWIVVTGYGLSMLAVGWYFALRTKNTDDYLLGGRNMKPWAVGLSYFATLFSTLTYLGFPGEMIRNGPMILSTTLSYPIVFLVVGHWLIPYIVRLKVTSAYEILEKRFGLSVRMLGSALFITLRLIWMSFIIFATSKHVLAPLLRLEDSATAWVAVVLGTVTVIYTSIGGLPAVIWTDVAQTFILIFGAILSIVMISFSLGGLGAWPSAWSSNWEQPKFWFDPSARVTMASAVLYTFAWYVCTAGSDQMAVQRYLATRDARSARRMFGISLCCDTLVSLLLAALGLALFAYFRAHPGMLPDGHTVISGADQLLPQYILKGLPAGISGLIVAGLLAAAMSSLSSGVSSSCSVITVDWIDRFRKTRIAEADHVQRARWVSWIVGLVTVSLSFIASVVQGNLLEASYKLVNLLTAPLFVLFFMAMFVPWATTLGAWAAGLSSIAAAVLIADTELTGLSFLWLVPVSLATGIVAGCLVSVLPVGVHRPMLEVEERRIASNSDGVGF